MSAAIDPATLDCNVHLFDLATGEELPLYTHFRAKDNPAVIYARPVFGGTLLERHGYAYLITTKVRGPSGALHASADLAAILGRQAGPAARRRRSIGRSPTRSPRARSAGSSRATWPRRRSSPPTR